MIRALYKCTTLLYFKYQNPSGFACLMLVKRLSFYPAGNTKFKYEKKNKLNSGSCSQMTLS